MLMDEVTTVQRDDEGVSYLVRRCPLRDQCWHLDRIEEESDLTMVMPRVGDDDA